MNRRLLAVLLVLFLTPSPAGSTHTGATVSDEPLTFTEQPLRETGIEPVDSRQEEALVTTNEALRALYDATLPTVRPAADDVPQASITLFEDGVLDDDRFGAIGDWNGQAGWTTSDVDPHAGAWNFALGDANGYPTGTQRVLVTPELDLRTDPSIDDPNRMDTDGAESVGDETASVEYENGEGDGTVTVRTGEIGLLQPREESVTVPDLGTRDVSASTDDPTYWYEFWARHNLGDGSDGVQVWVLEFDPAAPGIDPDALDDCTVGCTVVRPSPVEGDARFQRPTDAFDDDPVDAAFTGHSDWGRYRIDLTPWSQERVWVVYVFRAEPNLQGDAYFTDDDWFEETDFYGYRLDDVSLYGTAAPINIQVHELLLPDPDILLDHADKPLVETVVRNTGATALDVEVTVAITDPGADAGDELDPADYQVQLPRTTLRPGESIPVKESFPALGETRSDLEATVTVARFADPGQLQTLRLLDSEEVDAILEALDEDRPDPSLPVQLNSDAHGDDDAQSQTFSVDRIRNVVVGEPRVDEPWVETGDDLTATATVTNLGSAPETVTLLTTVLDVDDDFADVTDLLVRPDQRTQTVQLDRSEETTISWDLDTSTTGRFRIYVRTSDYPAFHVQLVDPSAEVVPSALTDATETPTVDGDLSDDAWTGASVHPITLHGSGEGDTRSATLYLLNTATDLYVGLTYPDPTPDLADDDEDDVLSLYFDDHGDRHLEDGEDAYRVGPHDEDGLATTDLAYDATTQEWNPEGTSGEAARSHDGNGYSIEIRRPLDGTETGGLDAAAGDYVGLALAITETAGDQTATQVYPEDASLEDDSAGDPLDGSLDDEARLWAAIETAPLEEPYGDYGLSALGFGVGTGPPATLHYDFGEECPVVVEGNDPKKWTKNNGRTATFDGKDVGQDTWQCEEYAPEGRNLMFVGLDSNGALCGTSACPQYAGGSGNDLSRQEAVMRTPEIRIEGNEPYLVLRHQYSTPVLFNDHIIGEDTKRYGDIHLQSIAYVTAHVDDEDEPYFLVPGIEGVDDTRHYDTEETNNIRDPRNGPDGRDFSDFRNVASTGTSSPPGYCRDDEPTAPTNPPVYPTCGWWAPTGTQYVTQMDGANYRPLDDDYPTGGVFSGSPWKIDRIPLFGTHWDRVDGNGNREDPYPLDLTGENVQFEFHYVLSTERGINPLDPALSPPKDYGWRISDIAVTEGVSAVQDLALFEAELATPYDAQAIGVGAGDGAAVPVEVTFGNVGMFPVEGARAVVTCYDATDGTVRGKGSSPLVESIEPGQTVQTTASCTVDAGTSDPGTAPRGKIRIEARVETGVPDDAPYNDAVQLDGLFDVTPSRDLAVEVHPTPEVGPVEFRRALLVDLHNRGNVPLRDFDVTLQVDTPASEGSQTTWTVRSELPVGGTLRLGPALDTAPSIATTDLRYNPLSAGTYTAIVTSDVDQDVAVENDRDSAEFKAVRTLYAAGFQDDATSDEPALVLGTARNEGDPVWSTAVVDGRSVLRAGDGDVLPAGADGSHVLPPIDLTSAGGATLVMDHAYDLERGYDGGRVEGSADGETWYPLAPVATTDAPLGYPDETLVGDSALLEGAAEAHAAAFTGSSTDHPLADDDGFVTTEFDLATLPFLQAQRRFADFPLDELAPGATESFEEGDLRYFTDATWTTGRQAEGWLIDNRAYNDPTPHSGDTMLWSTSVSEFTADEKPKVADTTLRIPIDLTGIEDEDAGAYFSFWDWRAGWQDSEIADSLQKRRAGSGAEFTVRVADHDDAGTVTPLAAEFSDDGWTRREIDLSGFVGDELTLEFHYHSDKSTEGHRNNVGWFLDDLEVVQYKPERGGRTDEQCLFADDLEGDGTLGCGALADYAASVDDDPESEADEDLIWSEVEDGLPRPNAWHVDTVPGPAGADVRAWRIAGDHPGGYPNLLDSRLVTPPVDLRDVVGTSATLEFEHRYELEHQQREALVRAIDGGVVEVQVYDDAIGAYGPWRQLTNGDTSRIILNAYVEGEARDYPETVVGTQLVDSGYSAIFTRGLMDENVPGITYAAGVGAPFDEYLGYCMACMSSGSDFFSIHPVGYAFSGDSDGWQSAAFDVSELIGEKVRFGFHAWSNPSNNEQEDPLLGWDVANVAVSGTVFSGQPTQLRLRAATDGSVLDGHWTIDRLDVSGVIHERNVALPLGQETLRFPSTQGIEFEVPVTNLGTAPRTGIALGVRAYEASSGDELEVQLSGPGEVVDVDGVRKPLDGEAVVGPAVLTNVGTSRDREAWTVRVPDAVPGEPVVVQARLLEDRGGNRIEDGKPVVDYALPDDDELSNLRASWRAVVEDASRVSFLPALGGLGLRTTGAGPGSDGDVTVSGVLRNDGTQDADGTLEWSLVDGDGAAVKTLQQTVHVDALGGEEPVEVTFTNLPRPSDYRATASFAGASAAVEFPVGRSENLATYTFDGDEDEETWTISNTSSRDASTRWNMDRVEGALSWGTHPLEVGGYCDRLSCGSRSTGVAAFATSPVIDLNEALNGRAGLTVDHSFFFTENDGGRVSVAVVDETDAPIDCGDDTWMPLDPASGPGHDGLTYSVSFGSTNWINPFGNNAPVFQGPVGSIDRPSQSVYDVGDATWCAEDPALATPLEDARVRVRLEVGITDRPGQPDRPGWQVAKVALSSGGVRLGPVGDDGVRVVEMVRNAPKLLAFDVQNLGLADDAYAFQVEFQDEPGSVSIVDAPTTLRGGERGLVWIRVDTTEDLPVGDHALRLVATSVHDAATTASLTTLLAIEPKDKPDLDVTIATEDGYEQGSIAVVPVTVDNLGTEPSKETTLLLEAVTPQGAETIDTLVVPSVCAPVTCGNDAYTVVNAEWSVPRVPGDVQLRATVDPKQTQLDLDRSNNVETVDVRVVPLQLPDLEVTSLTVSGADGRFLDENAVATVTAVVTNVGQTPAQGATLRILAGSATLTEAQLPLLVPGAEHAVSVTKVVGGASSLLDVRAIITGGLDAEVRTDNNEAILTFQVRTHDVQLRTPEGLAVLPGRTATVPVRVENSGNSLERLDLEVEGPEAWTIAVVTPQIIVPPEGSLTGLVLVTVPEDAVAGDRTLTLRLLAGETQVLEALATVSVATVLDAADVALDVQEVPSGDSFLAVTLSSNGNADQTVRLTDALGWLETTEVLLPAGEDLHLSVPLHVPEQTPPGAYDDALTLAPLDESWTHAVDNAWTVVPTLRVDASWAESRGLDAPGDGTRAVELTLRLVNRGNVPAELAFDARAENGTAFDAPGGLRLDPGDASDVPVAVRVDERLRSPAGTLLMNLTGGGLTELRELSLPDLGNLPDLVVVHAAAPPAPLEGVPALMQVLVRNEGSAPAGENVLHLYVDGVLAGVAAVPALGPLDEAAVNLTWTPRDAGDHAAMVLVDAGGAVLESHEDNNGRGLQLVVEDPSQSLLGSVGAPGPGLLPVLLALLGVALLARRWRK